MGKTVPEYTQKQINKVFAQGIYFGYERLDDDEQEIVDNVLNDWYILKAE